jgi:hypothetical protein
MRFDDIIEMKSVAEFESEREREMLPNLVETQRRAD